MLCRPRRGLFALVVIGGLKSQHTASLGHRPGEHGNTLSTGQQTASTHPHPGRDTKKSRPLKEQLERPAEVDYSKARVAAIYLLDVVACRKLQDLC